MKLITETIEGIPLYLIPRIIADKLREKGEAVFRIIVLRKFRHNYTIQVETFDEPAGPVPSAGIPHKDGEQHG
jgi:hypothetical protein